MLMNFCMICANSDSKSKRVSLTCTLAIVLFVHVLSTTTVVAQTCVVGDCQKSGCSFDKGIIRFGRADGTLVTESHFRIRIPHENINCHNQGSWERPGNSSRGVPYRSPCTKMRDKKRRFPDVWLSDFAVTARTRVSYKWSVNEEWVLPNFNKPTKVIVNSYLKCHESDSSMIIVSDNQGNSVMEIGIPLEFTPGGGDWSKSESRFIGGVILFILFCLVVSCICASGNDYDSSGSDFSTGFLAGMLASSDWGGSDSGGFGGFGDD